MLKALWFLNSMCWSLDWDLNPLPCNIQLLDSFWCFYKFYMCQIFNQDWVLLNVVSCTVYVYLIFNQRMHLHLDFDWETKIYVIQKKYNKLIHLLIWLSTMNEWNWITMCHWITSTLEVLNFLMKSVFDQMIDLMRLFIIYMILILFNTVK